MAKKSFLNDNPALRFITETEDPVEEEATPIQPARPKTTPVKMKPNPEFIETKSRRVQLVMQPSLYDAVKAQAIKRKLSVNEYIHKVLEEATKKTK